MGCLHCCCLLLLIREGHLIVDFLPVMAKVGQKYYSVIFLLFSVFSGHSPHFLKVIFKFFSGYYLKIQEKMKFVLKDDYAVYPWVYPSPFCISSHQVRLHQWYGQWFLELSARDAVFLVFIVTFLLRIVISSWIGRWLKTIRVGCSGPREESSPRYPSPLKKAKFTINTGAPLKCPAPARLYASETRE